MNKNQPLDLRLYLVTDRTLTHGRSLTSVVEAAVAGGVTVVQLREKNCSSREFYEQARALKHLLTPLGIPLIINDRLDIALAVDAEGLHIGQSDLPWQEARRLLGNDKILGLSVETVSQAREAMHFQVDYLGLSPVFATSTKTDTAAPLGLEGVAEIAAFCPLPLVAIGGISVANASQIITAGAHGIAVVSAIMSADDPKRAAAQLLEIMNNV